MLNLKRFFLSDSAPTMLARHQAEPAGVSRRIAPHDQMLAGNREHYFGVGLSALCCVRLALLAAGKERAERILDLPCGHGRVTRFLRAEFPEAHLTACDLLRDAVDFCAKTFQATPVYSTPRAADIPLQGGFDLIWCGSLLTHLDAEGWSAFLELFHRHLEPSGVLLFTTHGRRVHRHLAVDGWNYQLDEDSVRRLLAEYAQTGFGYQNYAHSPGYGVSLASAAWVLPLLESLPEWRVLSYVEHGWDDHQDVVVCQRAKGS